MFGEQRYGGYDRSFGELAEELRIISRHRKRLSHYDCDALVQAAERIDRIDRLQDELTQARQQIAAKNDRILALQGRAMTAALQPMRGTLSVAWMNWPAS